MLFNRKPVEAFDNRLKLSRAFTTCFFEIYLSYFQSESVLNSGTVLLLDGRSDQNRSLKGSFFSMNGACQSGYLASKASFSSLYIISAFALPPRQGSYSSTL